MIIYFILFPYRAILTDAFATEETGVPSEYKVSSPIYK